MGPIVLGVDQDVTSVDDLVAGASCARTFGEGQRNAGDGLGLLNLGERPCEPHEVVVEMIEPRPDHGGRVSGGVGGDKDDTNAAISGAGISLMAAAAVAMLRAQRSGQCVNPNRPASVRRECWRRCCRGRQRCRSAMFGPVGPGKEQGPGVVGAGRADRRPDITAFGPPLGELEQAESPGRPTRRGGHHHQQGTVGVWREPLHFDPGMPFTCLPEGESRYQSEPMPWPRMSPGCRSPTKV